MNVDYFRYLELAGNFFNFRLSKIQLGAQCLLGEHGPLSPNSDQYQILLCNIHAYSTHEVMRIKDMITQDEYS